MEQKQYINGEQDRRLEWLEKHYSNFNEEMSSVKVDLAKVKTDVCYLKKQSWFIITVIIGSILVQLFSSIF